MKQKLKKVINEWDPISLFPLAPKDEYISEIEIIENIISTNPKISVEKLAHELHKIFTERFGNGVYVCDIRECEEIAKKIFEEQS